MASPELGFGNSFVGGEDNVPDEHHGDRRNCPLHYSETGLIPNPPLCFKQFKQCFPMFLCHWLLSRGAYYDKARQRNFFVQTS